MASNALVRESDIHLERLLHLRDVVVPHVLAMAQRGRLNFDEFASDCGTYHCLAGWAACDPVFVQQGFQLWRGRYTRPVFEGRGDLDAVALFFGLDEGEVKCLFGPSYHGDLAKRQLFLDCIISARTGR